MLDFAKIEYKDLKETLDSLKIDYKDIGQRTNRDVLRYMLEKSMYEFIIGKITLREAVM